MTKITYKLSSFTIIELIVTLIISSIIITSVYYSINLISKHYNIYAETKSIIADIEIMDSNIKYAFFNCDEILISNNELLFISENNKSYRLTDTSITNLINNTSLYATEITTTALWNNQIVLNGNIDELSINIMFFEKSLTIHYFKDYALDKVIEINTYNNLEYEY